jgi:hypothetical protein
MSASPSCHQPRPSARQRLGLLPAAALRWIQPAVSRLDQALVSKHVNHSGKLNRPDGRRPLQLGERNAFSLVCVDDALDEFGRHGWCWWSHWLNPMC